MTSSDGRVDGLTRDCQKDTGIRRREKINADWERRQGQHFIAFKVLSSDLRLPASPSQQIEKGHMGHDYRNMKVTSTGTDKLGQKQ
jgi:hypothetical protein